MDVIEGVIYLAKCAVNEQMPDRLVIESLDLDAVYREAKRHMIASMCGMALKNAGVETEHFKQAIAMAQRKAITLNYERTLVCKALDEAGIWYVLLKGSVIQDWYPKLGMREMGDVDILFDESRAEDVKAIMTSLHYTVDRFGNGHSDDYTKKPLCHFEMHENLFGPLYRRIENKYFANIKERLLKRNEHEFVFSLEDFYIFILAHEYSHYINGGTGLRSLTDLFIFHKNFEKSMNWEYVKTELEKLRISQFWKDNYSLSEHLFGNGVKIDNNQEEMLEYILSSGTYGSLQNKVDNKINRFGGGMIGRLGYVVHRIILPMEAVKYCFPTFYKYKILMVFLPLYRIVIGFSNNRRSLSAEWKALKSSS